MSTKTTNELRGGVTRAMELRDELFNIANSYAGDFTGDVAVLLHQACNKILFAHERVEAIIQNKRADMTIFSPKRSTEDHQTCTKVVFKNYEISIAMDDSCGGLPVMGRTDIRVFFPVGSTNDVTRDFFPDYDGLLIGDSDSLYETFKRIDQHISKEQA
jgi:hypothetical protein